MAENPFEEQLEALMPHLKQFQVQLFNTMRPEFERKVRGVLERNEKLVNQDPVALDFLTEELLREIFSIES